MVQHDDRSESEYEQKSLVLTPNEDILAALESNLGPLGAGETYAIHFAVLTIGSVDDDYATVGGAGAYQVLRSYDPNSVSWDNFVDVAVPGAGYSAAAAATGTVGTYSTSWTLTDLVQDWLDGTSENYGLYFPDTAPSHSSSETSEYTHYSNVQWILDAEIVAVPIPSAILLFASGLLGTLFSGLRRKRPFMSKRV